MMLTVVDADLSLENLIADWQRHRESSWALGAFRKNIYDLIKRKPDQAVLEIGGGRSPMFNEEEIAQAKARYIINDISGKELSKAPDYCSKLCFDIASSDSDVIKENMGSCSLIFSQMVFEHVKDARQAYKNIYTLLAPGGICLNLHPILLSPPFVVNYLFPELLSTALLKLIDDSRVETEIPKFPAYYDRCRISTRFHDELAGMGFSRVWQIPFFHHNYFVGVPVAREIDRALSNIAERRSWNLLASYCYTCMIK